MSGAIEPHGEQSPDVRASDAEREQAAKLLQQALGQGRITVVEFDERMATAMAARTRGELVEVLNDIPEAVLSPVVPGIRKEVVHLRSGVGDVKKRGAWTVPPLIRVSGTLGDALLDFTEADFATAVTTIEVNKGVGDLVLVVPPDVTVDTDDVQTGLGEVKDRTSSSPAGRRHHIVVRGGLGMGDVKIMHPSSWRFGPWLVHRPFRITWNR